MTTGIQWRMRYRRWRVTPLDWLLLFLCVLTIGTFVGAVGAIRYLNRSGHYVAPVRAGDVYHRPLSPPLVMAARDGDEHMVKSLLERGVSPDAVARIRSDPAVRVTAMGAAIAKGHLGVLRLLLDAGADVNAPDSDGRTALWLAAVLGRTEMVKLLLQRGADVNVIAGHDCRISALRMASYGIGKSQNSRERRDYRATVAALEQAGAREWPPRRLPWWPAALWPF